MKNFNCYIKWVCLLVTLLLLIVNILFFYVSFNHSLTRDYVVQVNRLAHELETKSLEEISLQDYTPIVSISSLTEVNQEDFYSNTDYDYLIRSINQTTYRFNYTNQYAKINYQVLFLLNISFLLPSLLLGLTLFFIRHNIIKPFHQIVELPFELAKGNLSVPIKESKNKLFGKFLWGLNLLREDIEKKREEELALQKEKKTFILSLSHDIKTPLSAIKLYAKALSKNLYETKEKQHEIALNINSKVDEINIFISQIISASNNNYLKLPVNNTSFYLEDFMSKIKYYYSEKLRLLKIPYSISPYHNCLIYGDLDRGLEAFQNIMENAIKYGNGDLIDLIITEEEDFILVSLKNSGCNLPSHELNFIFDSFWRGSNSHLVRGSGLGLAIAKELITQMKGDIFATTTGSYIEISLVFKKLMETE